MKGRWKDKFIHTYTHLFITRLMIWLVDRLTDRHTDIWIDIENAFRYNDGIVTSKLVSLKDERNIKICDK